MTNTPQPPIYSSLIDAFEDNMRTLGYQDDSQGMSDALYALESALVSTQQATPDREGPIEKLERRLTGAITQRDAHKRHRHKIEVEKMAIKIDIWEQAIAILRQHEADMGTEQVQSGAKLNLSSGISLNAIIRKHELMAPLVRSLEALPQAHIRMPDKDVSGSVSGESAWYANMEDVIPLVRDYRGPQATEPVAVSLEKCVEVLKDDACFSMYDICGNRIHEKEIAKAVLTAAGVPYVD